MKLTATYNELINEHYDPKRLYSKAFIVSSLRKAPKYMQEYIAGLETVQCLKGDEPHICTYIPQVVYEYLFGGGF